MLIGLAGCKGAGKDTAGQWLVEKGYTRLAFADKLKEAVANLFNIPDHEVDAMKIYNESGQPWFEVVIQTHGLDNPIVFSWREFLQRFGTEMGRNTFGHNFWVDQWLAAYIDATVNGPTPIVVTDVRFNNEAKQIKIEGGFIIEIVRPGYAPDGHASEERLSEHLIDTYVENNTNLDEFKAKFLATVHGLSVGVVSG